MFSHVASLLALVPMLLHSIVGCCWHHAHHSACDSRNTHVVCQAGVEPAAGAHAHHASSSCDHHDVATRIPGESPTDPSPQSPCDEERCLFASTSLVAPQQVVALEWMMCSIFSVTADLPIPSGSLLSVSRDLVDGRPSIPVQQLRALTQVWLI